MLQSKKVYFFYQGISFAFTSRQRLKLFIEQLFKKEKYSLQELNVIFCSDEALLKINQDFLRHDYYTDIITFPLSEKDTPVVAELYISIDRIKDNATRLGVSFKRELHRVIFHGCLHLSGYNDKSSQQIKTIREREDYYLRLYFGQ